MQNRFKSILSVILIGCVTVGITSCYKRSKNHRDTDSDSTDSSVSVTTDPLVTDTRTTYETEPIDSSRADSASEWATDTPQTETASNDDSTATIDGTETGDTMTSPDTDTDTRQWTTPDFDLKPMPDCGDSGCHEDATCIYKNDQPVCQCKSGFEGNGLNCLDIDECAADSTACSGVEGGTCTNTRGSYSCCAPGKNLNAAQNQCVNTFTAQNVSTGDRYACALDMFGKAKCWGKDGDSGRTMPPRDRFMDIAAGTQNTTCGITNEGIMICWGGASGGIKADARLYAKYKQLSAGWKHFCALTVEGAALCFEQSYFGTTLPGAFTQVDAGYNHDCGIYTDGGLTCAGRNDYGECDVPTGKFKWVSAGRLFTCAVQQNGVATCFGQNTDGQCDVPEGYLFKKVVAGHFHACGLTDDNHIICWGKNYWGQNDAPEGTFVDVSTLESQSCGIRDTGEVVCWGSGLTPPYGTYTQVSAGFQICGLTSAGSIKCFDTSPDAPAPPEGTFSEISVNMDHGCAVAADGTVQCWGENDEGQCNAPLEPFASVSAGFQFTCARKQDGAVQCWGLNNKGQCDPLEDAFDAISMGQDFGCGLDATGKISCWGQCDSFDCASPDGLVFKKFKTGRYSICGITEDNDAVCLGEADEGNPFFQMLQDRKFTDVFAGDAYICAITTEGTVDCLGNQEFFFTPPPPEGTFTQLTGQGISPCGLRTDGAIACWAWITL